MRRTTVALLLLPLLGGQTAAQSTRLLVTPENVPPQAAARAYFSGSKVAVTLALEPPGSCLPLVATLVQLTDRLEAEWEQRRILECDGDADPDGPAIRFAFTAPKVERRSGFEWRFAACPPGGGSCDQLLSLAFRAYPEDLLEPLRVWAEEHVLVVRDPSGSLQGFLEQKRIPFHERPLPLPGGARTVTLLVERGAALEAGDIAAYAEPGSVILFRETAKSLPHVKTVVGVAPHRVVIVEMPLLAALAGSPPAQELLLEIFHASLVLEPDHAHEFRSDPQF